MKRYMAIKYLLQSLNEDDAIIIAGSDLCKEAFKHDDERILYLTDNFGYSLSIATGVAMTTKKRVFFICEDYYLLNNLAAAAQMSATRSLNVFMAVLITSKYQFVDGMSNIFETLARPKSILFDMGFTTHDYTKSFKTADGARNSRKKLKNARGPLSIFVRLDEGYKDLEEITLDRDTNIKRFKEFLKVSEES